MHLTIPHQDHEIVLIAESPHIPRHNPQSADNACAAEQEYFFGADGYRPTSCHRVSVRQGDRVVASRILLAGEGATGIHKHSAFVRGDTCFVAVGPFVCALELPTLRLLWHTRSDEATCFGIYDTPNYDSIISHGELEIARLSYSGQLLWSARGGDIFTEGFELHERHAEATDFNGIRYRFALENGQAQFIATSQ